MRKRLEELNERTQTHSIDDGHHEELVQAFHSKPNDIASPPIAVKAQPKKAG